MNQKQEKSIAKKNVHDTNFKHNFAKKEVAKAFFLHHLPQVIMEKIDIESLTIEPNEFIPSTYRTARSADLVYSLKTKKGEKIYSILHIEAQSKHKADMGLRLWEYQPAIGKTYVNQEGNRKIPIIITFVIYNGKEKWTSAKSVAELFEDFDLYVELALKAPFLIDLSKETIEKLKKQGAAAAPQMIMKGKIDKDYCTILEELYPLMEKYGQVDQENIDYMATLDKRGEAALLEKLSKLAPEKTEKYKTMFARAAKRFKKEGMEKGIKQGMQQGIKQGMQQGIEKGMQEGILRGIKQTQETIMTLTKSGKVPQEYANAILQALIVREI